MSAQDLTGRELAAIHILQGFCANPSVFQANPLGGWGLVNTTPEQLMDYVYFLADKLIERGSQPADGGEQS